MCFGICLLSHCVSPTFFSFTIRRINRSSDMNVSKFSKYKSDLEKRLFEPIAFTDLLEKVEKRTHVPRLYLVLGVVGFFSLYLIFGYFAELTCNFVGFVYPAYMSFKAIESPRKDDDTQWLTYWLVFALFNVVEFASDFIVGWFPFYWLAKCALMLYLYLPVTMGAQRLYDNYVRPFALQHEGRIDATLGRAKAAGEQIEAEVKKHMT